MIEGQLDAVNGATNSPPFLKVENRPRGLHFPPVPHDDVEGWKRLNDVVPWFFKHKATLGAAIPPEGQEMANTAYPILVSTTEQPAELTYNMTKAMVEYFDEYKDASPGANGWDIKRKVFDRSEEHTSELKSLMRNKYAVVGSKKKKKAREHIER